MAAASRSVSQDLEYVDPSPLTVSSTPSESDSDDEQEQIVTPTSRSQELPQSSMEQATPASTRALKAYGQGTENDPDPRKVKQKGKSRRAQPAQELQTYPSLRTQTPDVPQRPMSPSPKTTTTIPITSWMGLLPSGQAYQTGETGIRVPLQAEELKHQGFTRMVDAITPTPSRAPKNPPPQ